MKIFQEKSQITPPRPKKDEIDDKWIEWSPGRVEPALGNAREPIGRQVEEVVGNTWKSRTSDDEDPRKFVDLPPGMDISNQQRRQIEEMPLIMAGETDVSKDTNPEAFEKGFTRIDMKGSDDLYTGEHTDLFYSDAGGFCERNNYLDRN